MTTPSHIEPAAGLLDAVRQTFTYAVHQRAVPTLGPGGADYEWVPYSDKRATGFIYEGGEWVAPLRELGPPLLDELEALCGMQFVVAVMQAYQDGDAVTDWHADANYATEAILSLGATRHFLLRHDGETEDLPLAHGDVIVFPAAWEHSVPSDPAVTDERCSLVFRA